jgi:hypothetical protein
MEKYSSSNLIALISDTFQLYCADGEECQVSLLFTAKNGQGFFFFEELNTTFFCHQQKKVAQQTRLILFIHSSRTYDTYIISITKTLVNNEE